MTRNLNTAGGVEAEPGLVTGGAAAAAARRPPLTGSHGDGAPGRALAGHG